MKLRFTRRAREDLLDIWLHVAQDNPAAADRVADLIQASCETLKARPHIGRTRREIAEDARSIVIERWIAFYRVIGPDVQVVRIVDGARDLTRIWPPSG